jgi:hypothetical protein
MPYELNDSDLDTLLSYLSSCGPSLPPELARIHWEMVLHHALISNLPLPEGGPVSLYSSITHHSYSSCLSVTGFLYYWELESYDQQLHATSKQVCLLCLGYLNSI